MIKKGNFELVEPDGETKVKCDLNIDYNFSEEKFLLPSLITLSTNDPENNDFLIKWFYSWQGKCEQNDKMFTLSNFGLPEPDFGESRPKRIRYIIMFLGTLMILLAMYQFYQKRKN